MTSSHDLTITGGPLIGPAPFVTTMVVMMTMMVDLLRDPRKRHHCIACKQVCNRLRLTDTAASGGSHLRTRRCDPVPLCCWQADRSMPLMSHSPLKSGESFNVNLCYGPAIFSFL